MKNSLRFFSPHKILDFSGWISRGPGSANGKSGRGCLKSALVVEGLVPSQSAGAHKGLPYRRFRTASTK
jgi:hypothetical protein